MLGSAKTELHPRTLTSWVKDTSAFAREKGLGTGSLKKVFLGLRRDGFLQITAGPNFPKTQFATKSVRGPICLEPVYSNNIETQLDKIYI